jgi:8-oxo-dGTP pyrophosphatase MutT (NUDIX family)
MSEPFRTRRFQAVAPELRPHRSRSAARVIITDGASVLLLADTDPGLPGTRWWVTPGGGIDPGETPLIAAVREIEEETGLVVDAARLLGPIATRTVVHGYSDQVLSQTEAFFVLTVAETFDPDAAGQTPDEQITLDGWAWHPLDDLARIPEPVWPSDLAALAALGTTPERWPVDLGRVEESTLPLD